MPQTEPITVYTTGPSCQRCKATKRDLDRAGVLYNEVDVTTDPAAAAFVKGLGHVQAPVVYISEDRHWSDHRPTEISAYVAEVEAIAAAELTAVSSPTPVVSGPRPQTEPTRQAGAYASVGIER